MRESRLKPTLLGRIPERRVPIYIGAGLSEKLSGLPFGGKKSPRVVLVTDTVVAELYGRRMSKALRGRGRIVDSYELPHGERLKNPRTVAQLHNAWFKRGYDRGTIIIALGGGTVGDAGGYAAATFLRGLSLVQIPTTIVGQVDSAIGGKVGVNHPGGKNLIGCFYHPSAVVIDPTYLSSLPRREVRAGLAEVVKYGVIADPYLFRHCERRIGEWMSGKAILDESTIKRCVAIKLRVVEADERDQGARHILNFGHTIGHALEACGRYRRLRHGEAVTLGMIAAARIASLRSLLAAQDAERLSAVCREIAPARAAARFETEEVIPYLASDKKRSGGRNAWVLPMSIGRVTIVRNVTDKEIRNALQHVRDWLARE